MTRKITDLEGRLEAAFKRGDKVRRFYIINAASRSAWEVYEEGKLLPVAWARSLRGAQEAKARLEGRAVESD